MSDIAEILGVADRPPFADVKVKVSGLPLAGMQHLLVAEFDAKWQFKAVVPAKIGTHDVEADLSRAGKGRWRNFYVVRADADAVKEWEASKEEPLSEPPGGTKMIAGPEAHLKPLTVD